MDNSGKKWLSVYLYCAEPLDDLLTEAVYPFVRRIVYEEKTASEYFFIRYHERGPHVRLRLKSDEDKAATLRHEVENYFKEYFRKNPSKRQEPKVEKIPWLPNDSVQFIPYEPETERYGGNNGIGIAERQFRISSDTVFDILRLYKDMNYSRRMGLAVQLHLSSAIALGIDQEQAKDFFLFLSEHRNRGLAADIKDKFSAGYLSQMKVLEELFESVRHNVASGNYSDCEWMKNWVEGMKTIGRELSARHAEGRLDYKPCRFVEESVKTGPLYLWHMLDSYIHMSNNRLGIQVADEGFLLYLISKTV